MTFILSEYGPGDSAKKSEVIENGNPTAADLGLPTGERILSPEIFGADAGQYGLTSIGLWSCWLH